MITGTISSELDNLLLHSHNKEHSINLYVTVLCYHAISDAIITYLITYARCPASMPIIAATVIMWDDLLHTYVLI